MLHVRGLGKAFRKGHWLRPGERVPVLEDIGFTVERGEVVGLLGANGAGKTTILHAIAGLLKPDRGEILFDGAPLTARAAQRIVGLCSAADRSFYFRLSMRENLEFFARLYGLHGCALKARVDAVLAITDLTAVGGRRYSRCSTGTRQRLSIARALLHEAQILLLDEPTRAVDPLHAQMLRTFVRDDLAKRAGKTIVLATNLLEEAWNVCDRIVLLSGGRTIGIDTPAALSRRFVKTMRYRVDFDRIDTTLALRASRFGDIELRPSSAGAEMIADVQAQPDSVSGFLREILHGESRVKSITSCAPDAEDLFVHEASR
ncbi:MAG: ABC transporter ATP-binding protein [Candidatus Baltobacteraceae bacterium]